MNKSEKHSLALNIIAVFFAFLALCLIAFTVLYYLPREPAQFDFYSTEKTQYLIGEEIITSAVITVSHEADSVYDLRLRCENGRYLLRYFELHSTKIDSTLFRTSSGAVPEIPRPDECVIVNNACHTVNLFLGMSRTYCAVWETNKFIIL